MMADEVDNVLYLKVGRHAAVQIGGLFGAAYDGVGIVRMNLREQEVLVIYAHDILVIGEIGETGGVAPPRDARMRVRTGLIDVLCQKDHSIERRVVI